MASKKDEKIKTQPINVSPEVSNETKSLIDEILDVSSLFEKTKKPKKVVEIQLPSVQPEVIINEPIEIIKPEIIEDKPIPKDEFESIIQSQRDAIAEIKQKIKFYEVEDDNNLRSLKDLIEKSEVLFETTYNNLLPEPTVRGLEAFSALFAQILKAKQMYDDMINKRKDNFVINSVKETGSQDSLEFANQDFILEQLKIERRSTIKKKEWKG